MKKKYKVLILVIIILLISFVSSFVITNFNILTLNKSDRILTNINVDDINYKNFAYDNKKLSSINNGLKNIELNYHGYINKLIIEYKCNDNINFNIDYIGKNYYQKDVKKSLEDEFNSKLNKSYIKIGEDTKNLNLNFDTDEEFIISNIKIDNRLSLNIYLFIFCILFLTGICIIISYFKYNLFNKKIEYLFLSISLIIGSLFIILQPKTTNFSWDDQIHYKNMYKLYEFDGKTVWTKADHIMTEINPFVKIDTYEERILQNKYLNKAINTESIESNSPFITYNQVGYLIPSAVMKLCMLLGVSFTFRFLLVKFSMLLVYSFLIFFSIKLISRNKRIVCVLGLLPAVLFLATQFSYDAPIIGCIVLFIAGFINIIDKKNVQMNFWNSLIMILTIVIASFIKIVYIPLILLLLFIPRSKFKNNKQMLFFKIGVILIFILMSLTFAFPVATGTAVSDIRSNNTDVNKQLNLIIKNPIGYAKILKNTAGNQFLDKLISESTIRSFAYINVSISHNIYYILFILITFVIIIDSANYNNINENKKWNCIKIFNLILNFAIIILIWTALYLSFTSVGSMNIDGVQNRYFLPLLYPIILITFGINKIKFDRNIKKYEFIIYLIYFVCLSFLLYSVYFMQFCN